MSDSKFKDRLKTELFNQVPMNIAVIDRKYNIVEANRNFEEKFGEWQGKKCYTVYKGRKRKCKKCIAALTFEDGMRHVDDELGTDRHGRLTRRGNRWLRWAFVEAVWPGIRCSSWLRRCYERIKSRRGVKDARVATARKLAEVGWKIWTEGRCYEERH